MARTKILLIAAVRYAHEAYQQLEQDYEVICVDSPDRQSFFDDCKSGERYGGAHAVYFSSWRRNTLGQVDEEFVEALPRHLRYFCCIGAGYDPVAPAIPAFTKRGIQVAHTPKSVDNSTATTAMFLIVSCFRQFYHGQKTLREGKWKFDVPVANDPEGKLLGIVGLGGIGRHLVKRALAFDMRIAYHNRHRVDEADLRREFPGVEIKYYEKLEDLLKVADVVSVSVPLSDATRNLFSTAHFAAMKPGSYLINTARGGIVDEEALLAALDSKHLAGVGLDVFPNEPNVNPKLIENERVTLTPHMGTWTVETLRSMEERVIRNIRAGLETGHVEDLVVEQRGKL